jgi:hypothetical protein
MGVQLYLECSKECGYEGAFLNVGLGFNSEREARRCKKCGDFTDVLVARIEQGGRVAGSARGRCRLCGSQSLMPVPDLDQVSCPKCGNDLQAISLAIWD